MIPLIPSQSHTLTRRSAIRSLAGSSLLLPGIVSDLLAADAKRAASAAAASTDPLAPKQPHFTPKAVACGLVGLQAAPHRGP